MTSKQAGDAWLRTVWIDAQLPPAVAVWLARGHAVTAKHVLDVGLVAADDSVIFDAARAGGAHVVVTKDEDFVRLLERRGPPPQIVWVTCGNVTNAALRGIVDSAWPEVARLLDAGEPLVEIGRRS